MDLGGLVARNARTVPNKEAIIYEDNRYDWQTVNQKVNTVSNALIEAGVKKGDKVAMWMFNTDMFVFAFYGILKAGGVAVPVNFRLAPPEAEFIFGNCDAKAIIFDDVFEPVMREMKPRLENVNYFLSAGSERFDTFDPLADVLTSGDNDEPGVAVDEFDESEILYTSGTTGRPKGALFVHHNHITLVTTMATLIGIRPSDRLLHAAPLFHSAELNLYMNPGTYLGCSQTVVKEFVPPKILGLIEKEKITQFFGAPVMFSFMMKVPDFDKYDL
ncbi:MAG: AMP-binding protein, partial [Desulfobacterales bacterium]